jgi:inorganic triphosphatase YgiF
VEADREVELKFLCTPDDLVAVLAAAPAGDDESRELISVYFDTPELTLQKAGVSLRVRESKGRRVQTLKRGEGLSREEHEASIDSLAPDPELGPLKDLLPQGERLDPAFNVRVTRRQRSFRYQDAEIELALDQGEVVGGAARTPICEVELELKSGSPKALFALARELSKVAALYLSFDGKAARGQALVAGAQLQARRSEAIALARRATAAEAFQSVARNALGQISANALVLRDAPGPEAVHQLRVAARRLRSALSTFKAVVGDDALPFVKGELRWLAKSLDRPRSLDVLAEALVSEAARLEPPPAGMNGLTAALDGARREAWAAAAETAASERFRALMIEVAAWVETGDWIATASGGSAKSFGREALAVQAAKVRKRARHLRRLDDGARHRLRIESKKLRYAMEAFASLYPRKAAARYAARVKDLQEALGELNDVAVAAPLLATLDLAPDAALAAGELLGLRMAARPQLIGRAAKASARLDEARAPFA